MDDKLSFKSLSTSYIMWPNLILVIPVEAGVPQGAGLGPLFFLVYINDIADDISCNIKLFAEDTSILEIIQNQLESTKRIK